MTKKEQMNEENYTIYKTTNLIDGKTYIGATTRTLKERKLDHQERAHRRESNKFHEAISTYGAEAFSWEQIDTANTIDELAQKEKAYILEYNAKKEGYNSDSGGGFRKTVYQYSLEDGSLVSSYECLKEAGNVVNSTKQHISRACLSVNNTYKGFYWSYIYTELFVSNNDARKKKVIYYNFEDDTIQKFQSVAEAGRITGISKSNIAKYCRGERKPQLDAFWEYY